MCERVSNRLTSHCEWKSFRQIGTGLAYSVYKHVAQYYYNHKWSLIAVRCCRTQSSSIDWWLRELYCPVAAFAVHWKNNSTGGASINQVEHGEFSLSLSRSRSLSRYLSISADCKLIFHVYHSLLLCCCFFLHFFVHFSIYLFIHRIFTIKRNDDVERGATERARIVCPMNHSILSSDNSRVRAPLHTFFSNIFFIFCRTTGFLIELFVFFFSIMVIVIQTYVCVWVWYALVRLDVVMLCIAHDEADIVATLCRQYRAHD